MLSLVSIARFRRITFVRLLPAFNSNPPATRGCSP
jgi:hypothetical protein